MQESILTQVSAAAASEEALAAVLKIFSATFSAECLASREPEEEMGPRKGQDLQKSFIITFEEAAFGAKKQIQITKYMACEICDGTGG